jgi:diguanylate cyclase (GGDEF)-like protein
MAEDSIKAIGRWPWPRKWHAALIKILNEQSPRAIAFDVIFSEPQDPVDDVALEEAMGQAKDVYLPILYNMKSETARGLYLGHGIDSVTRPLDIFAAVSKDSGHINAIPDMDGILRRAPAIINYKGVTTYQFGIKIGFDMLGVNEKDIIFRPTRHDIIFKTRDGRIDRMPLDWQNQIIINWSRKWGREFRHYSYIDIIKSYSLIKEGKKPLVDLSELRDKICIIGLTASGLIDIKPVPIQNAYPAVGINGMILASVLNDDFIYAIPRRFNALILIFLSIFMTIYLSRLRLLGGLIFTVSAMISYALISIGLFDFFNIAVITFYPILTIFLSYSFTSIYMQVLQTLERARLFKQATRDGLTSLYNIRHFNLLFEAEFKNVSLYKSRRLSVIMADIDNFKHINDTYGHQAGDVILKEVAKTLQSKCREIDVVARYGGEEFIIMLSGAGEKEACDVAEKIRQAFETKRFRFKNDNYHTTISLGIAEFSGEKNKEELVEKADAALYKSKHEGKNKVSLYSSIGKG